MGCVCVQRLPTGGSIAVKGVQRDEIVVVVVGPFAPAPMLQPKKNITNDISDNLE